MQNFVSKVNILQGTNSHREFSTGNTLPIVARPWGMHHWTMQTAAAPWTFHPSHRQLWGIRLTHQPSPWMGDYSSLLVSVFNDAPQVELQHQASSFVPEGSPHYLKADLLRFGITCEMSPSERGALFVYTSNSDEPLKIRLSFDGAHTLTPAPGEKHFTGTSGDYSWGTTRPYTLHFLGQFSEAPESFTPIGQGGYWTFPASVKRLELRLAGSFLDAEGARQILQRELAPHTLDSLRAEGEAVWNDLLGRLPIEAHDDRQERTFYSCLYRTLLFPRFLQEIDAAGNVTHHSPYDDQVHPGPLCTDNGFWDTHRTVYPLLALVYPDKLKVVLEGWLNACREGGWTPKWASPGLRDCMIGTHFDAVVADAVARGITDWDVEGAFAYLWKNATVQSDHGAYGRRELNDYLRLGYVPADQGYHAPTSCTLDYAYNDFCVMQVALYLGKTEEAELLRPRTLNYRNVFDPAVGFMRERLSDGTWKEPFNEFTWGGGFVEGGAWQHTFNVPHDPEGLAALYGGPEGLCRKLDTMLELPATFGVGTYNLEIHEMTEMAVAGFGQYAQSNQPAHGFLFLYSLMGQTEKTSHWVRRVATELYSPDSLPGDEDNGEMSAWYVWATLGLYPQCPGKSHYVKFEPVAKAVPDWIRSVAS